MIRRVPHRPAVLPLALASAFACSLPALAAQPETLGQVVVTAPAMEAPLTVTGLVKFPTRTLTAPVAAVSTLPKASS